MAEVPQGGPPTIKSVSTMTAVDALGYLAASLVLATFCAKEMVPLRALAIASNIAFVAYAFFAGLGPILLLHSLMLPMNILRLREALEARNQPQLDVERGELDRANNNQNRLRVSTRSRKLPNAFWASSPDLGSAIVARWLRSKGVPRRA